MNVKPIGIIRSPFAEPTGTPINVRVGKGVRGTVEVYPRYAAGLKDLKELKGLQRLVLSSTKITDAGLKDLKQALPKTAIYGP